MLTNLLFLTIPSSVCLAAESPVAPGAELVKVASGYAFTEGPASDASGNVYFTDQPNDRIHVWDPDKGVSLFLEGAGRSNGLCFDADGRLWACADLDNELWVFDLDGSHTVVADNYGGRLLIGPNDVWLTPEGGAYLTDPYYARDYRHRGPKQQDVAPVY